MNPLIRIVKEICTNARKPPLPMDGVHVSFHRCWPTDLDIFMEMNNGRVLSVYDLGRLPLLVRTRIYGICKENGWWATMAGSTVRYRRRVTVFQRIEMHSQCIGYDDRFFYLQQTMWHKGQAASSVVYRVAAANPDGIVAPSRVVQQTGTPDWNPDLPDWVQKWIESEADRPWPPEYLA